MLIKINSSTDVGGSAEKPFTLGGDVTVGGDLGTAHILISGILPEDDYTIDRRYAGESTLCLYFEGFDSAPAPLTIPSGVNTLQPITVRVMDFGPDGGKVCKITTPVATGNGFTILYSPAEGIALSNDEMTRLLAQNSVPVIRTDYRGVPISGLSNANTPVYMQTHILMERVGPPAQGLNVQSGTYCGTPRLGNDFALGAQVVFIDIPGDGFTVDDDLGQAVHICPAGTPGQWVAMSKIPGGWRAD